MTYYDEPAETPWDADYELPDKEVVCPSCGAPVGPDEEACEECEEEAEVPLCPACDAPVQWPGQLCAQCAFWADGGV
ncbi:MAG: Double zinc ribbon [Actinomycetia bacterium]|nr:Double zinc ribbon [Actinomycetes bacterium]